MSWISVLFSIRGWYESCEDPANMPSPSSRLARAFFGIAVGCLLPSAALARDPGEPIRTTYTEGDLAGFSAIVAQDTQQPLGVVEYVQRRRGDVLEARRVSYFVDGSSDEDSAEVKLGKTLRAIRGRSIIRDTSGRTTVDIRIEVESGNVTGFYGLDKERKDFDEHGEIPQGTYLGPLINLVLKNFDANAEDGRLVFHTIVPTPGPRQLDMEVIRQQEVTLSRPGHDIQAVQIGRAHV